MKKLISFFIKYPIWSTVLKVAVFMFGFIALMNIRSSFFPERESHQININIVYPGSSPEEIEQGVVQKIEDNLKGVQGIERYTSISSENTASINVEVYQNYDPDEVLNDVRNAVDRIASFPVGMEPPVVSKAPALQFAINFAIYGSEDIRTLKNVAQKVEDDIRAIEGVSQVNISGFPPEEITISVDEKALRAYDLTFSNIANAVSQANIDISAGSVKTDEEKLLIRLENRQYYAGALEDVVVKSSQPGSLVRLIDVAKVENNWAEIPQKVFVNGKRAVLVDVNQIYGEDILEISEKITNYINEFNEENEIIKAEILDDFTESLQKRLDMLISNGLIGAVLVLVVLALFLNFRLAFWVALSLPFSFLGMFFLAWAADVTINVISLFGCIIVVGILVDDGIVVSEQIYQNHEERMPPLKAALEGTLKVLGSVTFATLTTVTMFMPFFFLEGRMGNNMMDMAFVVIVTLGFSLIEAAIILPAHLAHSRAIREHKEKSKWRKRFDNLLLYPRDKWYKSSLLFFIKHKPIAIALAVFLTLITIGAFGGGIIKTTFFPYIDSDKFNITLELPAGTREDQTFSILKRIEAATWEVNKDLSGDREGDVILKTIIKMAVTPGQWGQSDEAGENVGLLTVVLESEETRELPSFAVANKIREKVGPVYEAEKLTYGTSSMFGKPVSISLIGRNLAELETAKEELKEGLKRMPQLKDIEDNDPQGIREIKLELKEQAKLLGLTNLEVARQVRNGFFGEEVQRLQRGVDEVKVWVRYSKQERQSMESLENMMIRMPNGNEYPLSELVDYKMERGSIKINHLNGRREIRVEADLVDQNAEVPPILNEVNNDILAPILAKYPSVGQTDSGQRREIMKTARSSQMVMPAAFLFMFFLIVLAFRSFTQAIIVIALLPLGFIGAAWGHLIQGLPVNIMSAYGILALIGIIVNDSIVFINTMNGYLLEGAKLEDAVVKAGINRFRPILLTTVTTVAGLFPLLAETSRQAQFLIPMATSVAYGLLLGSIFILIFLPIYILIANKLKKWLKWLWSGRKPEPEDVEPAIEEQRRIEEYQHN